MKDSSTVAWLSKAIGQAAKTAKFCVNGSMPGVDPGIDVDDAGAIQLPLSRKTAKALVAQCRLAPYGKGTKTLTDKEVRNAYELDPEKFRLNDEWNSAIAGLTRQVATQLDLAADQLKASVYKLLVYERGGFFLPHRDSEKHKGMVASMIVVLPTPFDGGELVIRHGAAKQTFSFAEAAKGKSPEYVAFFADCEHEVKRVTGGVRLALAYNLVLQGKPSRAKVAARPAGPADVLAKSIRAWIAAHPAKPLVFALEHHYTEQGLSWDLMKGADRRIADLVIEAAEKTNCLVHMAQVSRHLLQYADDGSGYEYGRYGRERRPGSGTLEIGETYEDELNGTLWTDMDGQQQAFGTIAFDVSSIVASVPIDDWKPTSEEYEGFTGNAGNSLDRWYHRSAIVIWHDDDHFGVIARAGATTSIPLFKAMMSELAKTPKKYLESARNEGVRFARAIIANWPRRMHQRGSASAKDEAPFAAFPKYLMSLHDRDAIALFLSKLAEQDQALKLSDFVVAICSEHRTGAFAAELKQLLSASVLGYGPKEIPYRDVEWLAELCSANLDDPDKTSVLQELCALAVQRFCEARPPRPTYLWPQHYRESSVSEKSLPLLLTALVAAGCDQDLARVVDFVQASPQDFPLDDCQVPSLKSLIAWTRFRYDSVPPPLSSWLASVRQQLESATATPPIPPINLARPDEVACTCQYCAQLKAFLADPAAETTRIPARDDLRQHVVDKIARHQCDIRHTLDRKGSPYALLLTKTTGSYDRAVKQYEADRKLLAALPVLK